MSIPTLPGINARILNTARIATRVLSSGDDDGAPVIFVHGNLTSATFWEETMLAMPPGFHSIAHDQRGFGESDPAAAVDGARGLADMSDDVLALMDSLNIEAAHVVGHSMGGGVLWRLSDGCAGAPAERQLDRARFTFWFWRQQRRRGQALRG